MIDTNFGTIDARVDQLENQIDKILKLTPAVPAISTSSKSLPEENSETEIKTSDESTDSETPASETEIKTSDESTDSETPASETETKANDESTGSETPASEKSPKDTPEKED
jgi:uncharacterized membrane-anchored protein